MLRLWFSPLQQACNDRVISEICSLAASGVSRQILIVPEQFSFDTEYALCREGGDTIPRFAEVLSFSRLATRVFSVVGGAAVQTLDKSGCLIAMAGALEQVRSRLKIYGSYITKPEFLLQLLQISDEFKSYGISCDAIRRIGPTLSGTLAEKMDELTLIMEAYDAVCAASKLDPSSRLDALCTALAESDYAAGREIFISGFSDFTAQELQVIGELMRYAENVTVTLCCDDLLQGQNVFSVVRDTAAELTRLARRYEIPAEQLAVKPSPRPDCLSHLSRHLFSAALPVYEEAADEICLSDGASVSEECLRAASHIQRLLLQGCRLREIAVACTDSTYLPTLESTFSRYEIPCYFAGDTDVLRESVLRGVLAAVEAASMGMRPEAVEEYLCAGISPLSSDDCDRLKNYAYLWNIRGSLWAQEFTFDPMGYGNRNNAEAEQQLRVLNDARRTAILPLLTLKDSLLSAKNTAKQVLAVNCFLEQISLRERLDSRAQALASQDRLQQAQTCSQIYDILVDALEQIYGVLGETVRAPEDFCRFFRATLSRHSIGTVPATLDCVHIGQLAAMRGTSAKHLLLLGATDGLLPNGAPSASLLSDRERKTLTQLGLTLAPDTGARVERDLLCAYLVMTAPSESLYVSCRKDEACYLYARLKELFPKCRYDSSMPLPVRPLQAAADALQHGVELSGLPVLADAADLLRQRASHTPGTLSAEAVEALYGKRIYLSASKIDLFASCRFAFFLRYGLRAKKQMQAREDPTVFGNFVHDVLEKTARQVMAEGGFHTVTEERLDALAGSYMEQYIREQLNGLADKTTREVYLFRRSLDEVRSIVRNLWQELRQSDYIPEGFELEFSGEDAISAAGQDAVGLVVGKIDRVDLYRADGRTYLRVIDYKTGKKDFDYTDILSGIGLQMLIYLYALQAQGEERFGSPVIPAGVLYFPARVDVSAASKVESKAEAERQSAFRRKGLLLEDAVSLSAMAPDGIRPTLIDDSAENLASAAQLESLRKFVFRKIADMTDAICSGSVAPDPYTRGDESSSCRFCEYRAVCHVDSGSIPFRSLKKTDADRFWAEVDKEVKEDV